MSKGWGFLELLVVNGGEGSLICFMGIGELGCCGRMDGVIGFD